MGSKAIEICDHVEKAWATGQRAVELLREALGDEADNLVPLEGGGVSLHKIRGVMHDTCATANLAATLMKETRNTSKGRTCSPTFTLAKTSTHRVIAEGHPFPFVQALRGLHALRTTASTQGVPLPARR